MIAMMDRELLIVMRGVLVMVLHPPGAVAGPSGHGEPSGGVMVMHAAVRGRRRRRGDRTPRGRNGIGHFRWRRGVQEGADLRRVDSTAGRQIVLLDQVGQVLVGGDRDERVEILRRHLAPQAHRGAPPAELAHLRKQF